MSAPKPLEELLEHVTRNPALRSHWLREMARRLRKLAERHQRVFLDGAPVCKNCLKAWPCPDAEILEGR